MTEVITSWVTLGALFGALVAGDARRPARPAAHHPARRRPVRRRCRCSRRSPPAPRVLVVGPARRRLRRRRGLGGRPAVRRGDGADPVSAAASSRPTSSPSPSASSSPTSSTRCSPTATLAAHARRLGGARACSCSSPCAPMPETPRWLMRRRPPRGCRRRRSPRSRPDVDVETTLDDDRGGAGREDADQASWGEVFARSVRKPLMVGVGLAVVPADHRHQRHHLLRRQIFASAGFSTPAGAGRRHHVGHRRGQRARHLHRRRLRRPLRPPAAAAARPRRAWPSASSPSASPSTPWTSRHRGRGTGGPTHRRHLHARRAGGVHRLVRLLARPGGLDGHQRDLPRTGSAVGRSPSPPRSTGARPSSSASSS